MGRRAPDEDSSRHSATIVMSMFVRLIHLHVILALLRSEFEVRPLTGAEVELRGASRPLRRGHRHGALGKQRPCNDAVVPSDADVRFRRQRHAQKAEPVRHSFLEEERLLRGRAVATVHAVARIPDCPTALASPSVPISVALRSSHGSYPQFLVMSSGLPNVAPQLTAALR